MCRKNTMLLTKCVANLALSKLKIFKVGYRWGCFESLITFPTIGNRIFKNKISGNIIRIYCGLEDSKDQINDICNALKTLK